MTVTDIPLIAIVKRLLDPCVIIVLLWVIVLLHGESFSGLYVVLAVFAFLVSSRIYDEMDIYQSWRRGELIGHARDLFIGWVATVAVLAFSGYATGLYVEYSEQVLLVWVIAGPFALLLAHLLIHMGTLRMLVGKRIRPVVIVGANELSTKLARQIIGDPYLFMEIKGYFDDRIVERHPENMPVPMLGKVPDLVAYVRENNTNIIFICLPMAAQPRIFELLDEARDTTASIYFVPDIHTFDLIQPHFDSIHGIPIVSMRETPFLDIDGIVKYGSDMVLGSIILLMLLPLMAVIATAVKLTSPGPIIFKQRRYGLNGEEIIVYKFRSMTVCEDGPDVAQARKSDSRITRLGGFLRKTSLDELPQFINVLQGRMSIVGPRPHAMAHNELYRKLIKGYMLRHKVKPGITGWAQVNGLRGETETLEKMQKRVEFDLYYLRNWSLLLDLWIIMQTAWIVARGDDAY